MPHRWSNLELPFVARTAFTYHCSFVDLSFAGQSRLHLLSRLHEEDEEHILEARTSAGKYRWPTSHCACDNIDFHHQFPVGRLLSHCSIESLSWNILELTLATDNMYGSPTATAKFDLTETPRSIRPSPSDGYEARKEEHLLIVAWLGDDSMVLSYRMLNLGYLQCRC